MPNDSEVGWCEFASAGMNLFNLETMHLTQCVKLLTLESNRQDCTIQVFGVTLSTGIESVGIRLSD